MLIQESESEKVLAVIRSGRYLELGIKPIGNHYTTNNLGGKI